MRTLGIDPSHDALVYVPNEVGRKPAPLLVILRGAHGYPDRMLDLVQPLADENGIIVLDPTSRGETWDAVRRSFGPDVKFIDQALAAVFDRCSIDTGRIGVLGFSDGASYALTIGVMNGDLFSQIMAIAPGGMRPTMTMGRPPIFIAHGQSDQILPIAQTSRIIVPQLRAAGYSVTYEEFSGRHELQPAILRRAVEWMMSRR